MISKKNLEFRYDLKPKKIWLLFFKEIRLDFT